MVELLRTLEIRKISLLFFRVCCLEASVLTHWGRRTLRSTGWCAPGCRDWGSRHSSWTSAEALSTPTEPSSRRTCLTSSTWRLRATAASPSPSATCCFRFWRRRQRRDGRRWFEGRGCAVSSPRGMPHPWRCGGGDGGDMFLVSAGGQGHSLERRVSTWVWRLQITFPGGAKLKRESERACYRRAAAGTSAALRIWSRSPENM